MNTHLNTSGGPEGPGSSNPSGRQERLAREKAFFVYWSALERGDLETCERILRLAAADPELSRAIIEAHDEDAIQVLEARESDAAQVRDLAAQAFSAPVLSGLGEEEEEEAELAPLTVADVAARMQADDAQSAAQASPQEADLLRRLSRLSAPIPDKLSPRGVRRFLESLGVTASERAQAAFRETAVFLQMGRQQNMAQMAATRRARQQSQQRQAKPPQVLEAPHNDEEEAP